MEHVPHLNLAVAITVKRLRNQSGYSQEELAGFAKTSRSQIAQLESGERGVTLSSLFWLADSFSISFLDFIHMILKEMNKLEENNE